MLMSVNRHFSLDELRGFKPRICNSFATISIGERFIVCNRQHPDGDPSAYFFTDLRACNLMWSFQHLDDQKREKLTRLAGESGQTVEMDHLDTVSFVQVLENAHKIGGNYDEKTSTMAPLPQLIHETAFNQRMQTEYIDVETSFVYVDAVRAVTRLIRPAGILAYDDAALSRNETARRFQSLILPYGFVNQLQRLTLNVPVRYTMGQRAMIMGSGRKATSVNQSYLYFVVAPFNEILCGPDKGKTEAYGPMMTTRSRTLVYNEHTKHVVYDQQYTGIFYFTEPGKTWNAVHADVRRHCLRYTKSNTIRDQPTMHRTIATIRLGIVPIRTTEFPRVTHEDGRESYVVSDLLYCPESTWTYTSFNYEHPPDLLRNHTVGDTIPRTCDDDRRNEVQIMYHSGYRDSGYRDSGYRRRGREIEDDGNLSLKSKYQKLETPGHSSGFKKVPLYEQEIRREERLREKEEQEIHRIIKMMQREQTSQKYHSTLYKTAQEKEDIQRPREQGKIFLEELGSEIVQILIERDEREKRNPPQTKQPKESLLELANRRLIADIINYQEQEDAKYETEKKTIQRRKRKTCNTTRLDKNTKCDEPPT